MLAQIQLLLIPTALALLVLAVALDAGRDDLLYVVRRPWLLVRAILAISVVVPLAAVAAVSILPLGPLTTAGVILMAVAPVPPVVPGKALKLGGRKEYVYGLFFAFSLLALAAVPVTLAILGAVYHREVVASPVTIGGLILMTVIAPLAAGSIIRALFPRLAAAAIPWASGVGGLLLAVVLVMMVVRAAPAMAHLVGDGTVVAVILVSAAGLLAGYRLGGPERCDRLTLASAAATRHPGIAMAVAGANFPDPRVSAAIVLYLLVSTVMLVLFQVWARRSAPHGGLHPA